MRKKPQRALAPAATQRQQPQRRQQGRGRFRNNHRDDIVKGRGITSDDAQIPING